MDSDPTSRGSDNALLRGIYEAEPYDPGLKAALLSQIAQAHPGIDPEAALARATTVATTLAHLAGAAESCGGIDALLRNGNYRLRVIFPSSEYR